MARRPQASPRREARGAPGGTRLTLSAPTRPSGSICPRTRLDLVEGTSPSQVQRSRSVPGANRGQPDRSKRASCRSSQRHQTPLRPKPHGPSTSPATRPASGAQAQRKLYPGAANLNPPEMRPGWSNSSVGRNSLVQGRGMSQHPSAALATFTFSPESSSTVW